ncbi:helix-turn-helix domain-containing protein [Arthrobacter cavernae]
MRPAWTLSEAADRCGVSRSTVRRYRETGKFPGAYKTPPASGRFPCRICWRWAGSRTGQQPLSLTWAAQPGSLQRPWLSASGNLSRLWPVSVPGRMPRSVWRRHSGRTRRICGWPYACWRQAR